MQIRDSGEPRAERRHSILDFMVKGLEKVGNCRGEDDVKGMKALGWGNNGQMGRSPSLCKVAKISKGATIEYTKILSLLTCQNRLSSRNKSGLLTVQLIPAGPNPNYLVHRGFQYVYRGRKQSAQQAT